MKIPKWFRRKKKKVVKKKKFVNPYNRETVWGANGAHSQKTGIMIKDLEDGHLVNIMHLVAKRHLEANNSAYRIDCVWLGMVLLEEVERRDIKDLMYCGKHIPFESYKTGEVLTKGEY